VTNEPLDDGKGKVAKRVAKNKQTIGGKGGGKQKDMSGWNNAEMDVPLKYLFCATLDFL